MVRELAKWLAKYQALCTKVRDMAVDIWMAQPESRRVVGRSLGFIGAGGEEQPRRGGAFQLRRFQARLEGGGGQGNRLEEAVMEWFLAHRWAPCEAGTLG